ncbi:MAG: hypothetical protein LBU43_06245 [Candidatus Accumulibacter sp.]|jgi:Tfp pilus tip-associated adhesin PilY1|nr:hypothetical protein [Accumulibacter sp.]
MKTSTTSRIFFRTALLAASLLTPPAFGGLTEISETPISGAISMEIKPNILFIMDDSGSMDWDYLPDWAEETGVVFPYQSKNASFNGVAYNPAITYVPPVYFNADGSTNDTKYPSQTRAETSDGTNGWAKVKTDGYGIQSTDTTNLVYAYYYTTVPGEYCKDRTLKDCANQSAASETYPVPARLRWCKTDALAKAKAQPSGTNAGACQAVQVEKPDATSTIFYTFPRLPAPRRARLTIAGTASNTIFSNIKVTDSEGIKEILSAPVNASTFAAMAEAIIASINACTYKRVGNCTIAGYSADKSTSFSATVAAIIITAPVVTGTSAVTKTTGSMTAGWYNSEASPLGGNTYFIRPTTSYTVPGETTATINLAPGENLLTVIESGRSTYPKAATRADCAGDTCTYDEEMTNYANWWAYYRTRMQAMKTATSRSFESINDKYRIGYLSINNNTGTDFQNISEFDYTHKQEWYDKLFASKPVATADTPLRAALSKAGRLYAGKLNGETLNGVAVEDPMQYYCQPNVAILSTDGYWTNKANEIGFKLDGTTLVDDQDNNEIRPMLDAGTGVRKKYTIQRKMTLTPDRPWYQTKVEQREIVDMVMHKILKNVPLFRTAQLQKRGKQYQAQLWHLQSRSKNLWTTTTQTGWEVKEYPLKEETGTVSVKRYQLQTSTKNALQKTTGTLQYRVATVLKTTTQLKQTLTQVYEQTSSNSGTTWTAQAPVDSCTPVTTGTDRVKCTKPAASAAVAVDSCVVKAGLDVTNNEGKDNESVTYNTKSACAYYAYTTAYVPPTACVATSTTLTDSFSVPFKDACGSVTYSPAWTNVSSGVGSCSVGAVVNTTLSTATSGVGSGTTECQYAWGAAALVNAPETCTATTLPYTYNDFVAYTCSNDGWSGIYTDTNSSCTISSTLTCKYREISTTAEACPAGATTTTPQTSTAVGTVYSAINPVVCTTAYATTQTNASSCTASTSGATVVRCSYATTATSSTATMAQGCAAQSRSGGPNYVGPARECKAITGTGSSEDSCNSSGVGVVACTPAWSSWADASSCTSNEITADEGKGSVECQYVRTEVIDSTTGWFNADTCTPTTAGTTPPSSTPSACTGDCIPGDNGVITYCQSVNKEWGAVGSGETCESSSVIGSEVECRYDPASWTDSDWQTGSCPDSNVARSESSPYTVITACENGTGWSSQWDPVNPWTIDANCSKDDTTKCELVQNGDWRLHSDYDPAYPPVDNNSFAYRVVQKSDFAPPLPTALSVSNRVLPANPPCTPNQVTAVNGTITTCRSIDNVAAWTGFAPDCTEADASAANNWLRTECTETVTAPTTVTSCTPIAPLGPNYIETLCDIVSGASTPDTLADVAEYYYITDLRDETLGNCISGSSGNDVCANTPDQQRMSTYTLGLGASGVMQYQADYKTATSGDFYSVATEGVMANPTTGVCSWQEIGQCNWPKPLANKQTTIDDLWHAAVNGRGSYFSAENPASMAAGISTALQEVMLKDGSLAAITVTSPNLSDTDSVGAFQVSFTSGTWVGDVQRLDLSGSVSNLTKTLTWSAKTELDKRSASNRNIYFFKEDGDNKLASFEWGNLTDDQRKLFQKPNIGDLSQLCAVGTICLLAAEQGSIGGESLVNFLRGDRSHEGPGNELTMYYRQRANLLGDIVGSEAVYVQHALWSYIDRGYGNFKERLNREGSGRAAMIYVGANDGMLHAFKADKDKNDGEGGKEAWAYIPTFMLPKLYQLADKNYSAKHRYYVDGTPVMGDICAANCAPDASGTAEWKTILVGGVNLGGKGYYALDITDPANPKGMWEFTDENLGYTFGNPVITKLTDGTWVVLLTSGYNNTVTSGYNNTGDGKGRLFVLDANSGETIRRVTTSAGSSDTPSGLAKIAAWADYPTLNNTALWAYGGDLLGNVWRFDINDDGDAGNARLIATLKDDDGKAQPITTRLELALVLGHRVVFAGTGQLLGLPDLVTETRQSVYALKDPWPNTVVVSDSGKVSCSQGLLNECSYDNLRDTTDDGRFVRQVMKDGGLCPAGNSYCVTDEPIVKITKNPVDWDHKDGWYVDFLAGGERVNTTIKLLQGTLALMTNKPQSGACVPAGVSYFYFLDYVTGGYVGNEVDENGNGFAGGKWGDFMVTSPVFVRNPDGTVGILGQGDGSGPDFLGDINGKFGESGNKARRLSWRELIVK